MPSETILCVRLRVKIAWWLPAWLWALDFFARLTDAEPDMEKVQRLLTKAVRIEVERP